MFNIMPVHICKYINTGFIFIAIYRYLAKTFYHLLMFIVNGLPLYVVVVLPFVRFIKFVTSHVVADSVT